MAISRTIDRSFFIFPLFGPERSIRELSSEDIIERMKKLVCRESEEKEMRCKEPTMKKMEGMQLFI